MQFFQNAVILRGHFGKDAEVPSSDAMRDDVHAVHHLFVWRLMPPTVPRFLSR